jgi:hypothetical protein
MDKLNSQKEVKMVEEKTEKDWIVVPELPQVPTRTVEGNDGKEYELVTLTEAVKEILEIVREIKKGVIA